MYDWRSRQSPIFALKGVIRCKQINDEDISHVESLVKP